MKRKDLEKATLVQHNQLQDMLARMAKVKELGDQIDTSQLQQAAVLGDLDTQMGEFLATLGVERNQNLESVQPYVGLTRGEEAGIDNKYAGYLRPLDIVEFTDLDSYLQNIDGYLAEHNLDTNKDPILQLFPAGELEKQLRLYEEQFGKIPWTQWDYTAVAISAVLAVLVDIFLVKIPNDMVFKGQEYKGSPLTKFFNQESEKIVSGDTDNKFYGWLHNGINYLEKNAKVPYDVSVNSGDIKVDGLNPHLHRLMSLGHDPALGFVFGVIDILRGTMTIADKNGVVQTIQTGQGSGNILEAFMRVFAHLLSDLFTKAGVPPPFFGLLQTVTTKSPFSLREGGEQVSYNNVVRFMYKNGYDLRHFATMSIVPFLVEACIRTYYNIAHFETLYKRGKSENHRYKLASMLTFAHGLTTSGNVIKVWMNGWNPLALNYSEILMLVKSCYSLYQAHNRREKWIERELMANWHEIYRASV